MMKVQQACAVAALVVGIATASAAPATAVTIRGSGTRWRPARVNIDRGDRVRWRAVSGNHTVHAYGGNWRFSERLDLGDSVSKRFRRPGTYRFYCTIHGNVSGGTCTGMCGKVRV